MTSSKTTTRILGWVCRITAAVILLQTLFFKFTGASESVFIFSKVGIEPWGRYGTGVAELVAALLLLVRCKAWMGALLATVLMGGAITSHLTILGVVVQGDGGLLFGLAVTVLTCSLVTVYLERGHLSAIYPLFAAKFHDR